MLIQSDSFARFCVIVVLAAHISGCVQFEMTPEVARSAETLDLCKTYAASRYGNATKESGAAAAAELARRSDISSADLKLVAKGVAAPGMAETAGLCAWGGYWNDVNTTATGGAISRQYVFGDGTYVPIRYLYATNGVVTAVQY